MMPAFDRFKQDIAQTLANSLSAELCYHGYHHTLEVSANTAEIARHEQIEDYEQTLLQTAVWLHDAGFMFTYNHHEERGCELARSLLPNYHFSNEEIDLICGLIEATKIPQQPKTHLQQIIADADLMYLGTPRYAPVANTLFHELAHFTGLHDEKTWIDIQIKFLEQHQYHTHYCRVTYEPIKQQNLRSLKASLPL